MSVTLGSRLGVYEIVSALGAGGMGEVYRARDTKLNRDVAIKVLPEAFAVDADRLARFTREAQVLASLNHPNIAAIYGFEGTALVMELVEGEDLSQRIARGALPLDEALPIARQIAEALEAAHEQGIIHRDLKPANVKVRPDGTVKVLDFGLAKAIDQGSGTRDQGSGGAANSPTITTPAMTMRGMILGTAAYMSPEQAKGKVVDKRADIWAFGAVLYEMLTGARAFRGEDTTDTIVGVISKEPDWSLVPAAAPARLIQLLRRCLQKDAKVRLRDIGEARVELSTLISRAPEPAETMPTPVLSRRRSIAWLAAGVAIGAAAILLTAPWWRPAAPVSDNASVRFPLNWPEGVTPVELVASGSGGTLAVSPDGRAVVLMASSMAGTQLWLRLLEADHARPLAGTEGGAFPFWSPDSAAVAFFSQGGLKRIEIATGLVTTICTCATTPLANRSGTWGADDVIVFSGGVVGAGNVLYRVSASGGAPSPLTTLDTEAGENIHAFPTFLPDGRRYLFAVVGAQSTGVYAGAIDSSERRLVLNLRSTWDFSAFAYAPSGHLLYVTDHRLVAHPFDQSSLRFTGEPVPIAEGFEAGGPGQPPYAVSDTGVLVFRPVGAYPQIQPVWVGRTGARLGTVGVPGPYSSVDLAPDERTLAVGIRALEGHSIWTIDGERGTSSRL